MPDSGWPYGSLVMAACDQAARPLLLISDLAEHTTNLGHDNRASLLFDGTAGLDSPLTGTRVTVLGTLTKTDDPALVARYTARHPESKMFAGFADFNLYEMAVERAHIVAGFGVIHWVDPADLLFDIGIRRSGGGRKRHRHAYERGSCRRGKPLCDIAAGAGRRRLDNDWRRPWGCDLRNGGAVARVDFEKLADNAESARSALVRLPRRPARQHELKIAENRLIRV